MTAGHKHREVRVHRHSLITRVLTHPLVFSDDLERVDASPYPWGPIAGPSDPVPTMTDGQPVPHHLLWHSTPPGHWYLSALSVLHRWTGLTLRIPDDEVDRAPWTSEQVEAATAAITRKLIGHPAPVFVDTGDLEALVRQVVADTVLLHEGVITTEDMQP